MLSEFLNFSPLDDTRDKVSDMMMVMINKQLKKWFFIVNFCGIVLFCAFYPIYSCLISLDVF